MDESRRCQGHLTDGSGRRCKRAAILGGTVCVKHGGGAPQVRAKANERILEMVNPALATLARLVSDGEVADNVKLAAVKDVLDRAGLTAKQVVEVTHHDGDSELDDEIARLMERMNTTERIRTTDEHH